MSTSPNTGHGLAMRIGISTELSHTVNPSSEIGPEPMDVPVTGHSIIIEMTWHREIDLRFLGFRAEVIRMSAFEPDSVSLATGSLLEIPHFEVLLDQTPPLIRTALKSDGSPARPALQFPLILHPGEQRSFFLAPITHSSDLTEWSLYGSAEIEGNQREALFGTFRVTGNTGWLEFRGGGKPRPVPVGHGIAPNHWDIQYKATTSRSNNIASKRMRGRRASHQTRP